MIENIYWLTHGSFLIRTPQTVIYINPWRITQTNIPADVILISNNHYEYFSLSDIQKLSHEHTRIITNEHVVKELPQAEILRPWQSITVKKASIKAVPAYSTQSLLHRKEGGGLGFTISMNYYDIYYAGATEIIPEMQNMRPDIAILPIDGNGTLTVEQAVKATEILKPKWVIPSNWGKTGSGATPLDVVRFRNLIKDRAKVTVPMLSHV